jgi:hypothetical protein
LERQVIVLEILHCGTRRGPYSEASQLYCRLDDENKDKAPSTTTDD